MPVPTPSTSRCGSIATWECLEVIRGGRMEEEANVRPIVAREMPLEVELAERVAGKPIAFLGEGVGGLQGDAAGRRWA
jgi:hypothetical protein